MRVRFVGFTFEGDAGLHHFGEFAAHLSAAQSSPINDDEVSRMLFFNDSHSTDYYIGLVVTVRDQKAFCQLQNEGGRLVVRVSEVDENSQHMDFSFFVLHKRSLIGLYQTYHGSCSASAFFGLMKARYRAFLDDRYEDEVAALPSGSSARLRKEIKNRYWDRMDCRVLVRNASLQQMIEQMSRVREFTYSFATLVADELEFEPIGDLVRKEKRTILFRQQASGSSVAGALSRLVDRLHDRSGSIVGEDIHGLTKTLRFFDNPDVFQDYDYDDVARRINSLGIESFHTSWVVDRLLETCREHDYLFEARTT